MSLNSLCLNSKRKDIYPLPILHTWLVGTALAASNPFVLLRSFGKESNAEFGKDTLMIDTLILIHQNLMSKNLKLLGGASPVCMCLQLWAQAGRPDGPD